MDIQNVIKKYNYEGELANFLPKLYLEFINYLGKDKEPIIYEALLNTEIITCNNVYNALLERQVLEDTQDALVKTDDLKRASGVYHVYPSLTYNLETKQFEVGEVKRIVAINATNFTDYEYSKTVLIHELSHLIKSYYEEFKIEGDILTTRSGLIETKEKLEIIDGKLHKTLIKEENVGLEEGLTSLMEEDLARVLVNPSYEVHGYGVVNAIAKILMNKYGLKEAILDAQMLNDKENLIKMVDEVLGTGNFFKIAAMSDKIYELTLKMFSEIFDSTKMQKTSAELNAYLKENFVPLMNEIETQKIQRGG